MRIIGNREQPLIGESLLWLIARASELNFFCRAEVVKVFADHTELAFSTMNKRDPGTLEGFDIQAIKSLFNISEKNIAYSLFGFYSSFYLQCIRICPKCAEKGTHLFVHQVELFDKCPVHNQKLINKCQVCGSILGNFLIKFGSREEIFNPFRCKNCNNSAINSERSTSKYEIRKLKNFFVMYSAWREKISKANKKIYLIDTKKLPTILSIHSTIIMPKDSTCPERFFYKKKNHEEIECSINNLALNSISRNINYVFHDETSKDVLIYQYAKQLMRSVERYKAILKKTFNITSETILITLKVKTQVPLFYRKTGGYSIWCEALIYLENYIGNFEKEFDRYIYWHNKGLKKLPNYNEGNLGLFESFMDGPLRILTMDERLKVNKRFGYQMLNLWIKSHIYSIYCNYLGKIITQDLSRYWLYGNSGSLDGQMLYVDDGNNYFYYYHRNAIRFHISGNKRINLPDLISIFKSGFVSTYGFEYSERKRQFIRKISIHCDLDLYERGIISRALREGKKA